MAWAPARLPRVMCANNDPNSNTRPHFHLQTLDITGGTLITRQHQFRNSLALSNPAMSSPGVNFQGTQRVLLLKKGPCLDEPVPGSEGLVELMRPT